MRSLITATVLGVAGLGGMLALPAKADASWLSQALHQRFDPGYYGGYSGGYYDGGYSYGYYAPVYNYPVYSTYSYYTPSYSYYGPAYPVYYGTPYRSYVPHSIYYSHGGWNHGYNHWHGDHHGYLRHR